MRLEPGVPLLYMKVGTHAREDLDKILTRKREEIRQAGMAMWGYGGNTCHPTKIVQPFAKAADRPILLCMQPMQSRHHAEPTRAKEFSVDGLHWNPVPPDINVLGSKFALCIGTLEDVEESLDLSGTRVALGNSKGKTGTEYIRGRVDKGCLEIVNAQIIEPKLVDIRAVAEIVEPYAVMLRD